MTDDGAGSECPKQSLKEWRLQVMRRWQEGQEGDILPGNSIVVKE